jgi:hypothetical protein
MTTEDKNPCVVPGDRIRALFCLHLHEQVLPGETGTVTEVLPHGVVVVKWDDGSERWLVPGQDGWEVMT